VAVVAYSSVHQTTRSSVQRAECIPLGSSGTKPFMESMKMVGGSTPVV
jgi:hypothetical protein